MRIKLIEWWHSFQYWFYAHFGRDYKCGCGHVAKWKTIICPAEDYSGLYCLGKEKENCPNCYLSKVIQCALCKKPIVPGSYVTLLFRNPDQYPHATVYKEQENSIPLVIGCVRFSCSEFGRADAAGIWEMPGKFRTWPSYR
ncbi:MAG: hypothetical protein Q7T49_00940 [bacterium]|nr:hypothetical protein [bacterium]